MAIISGNKEYEGPLRADTAFFRSTKNRDATMADSRTSSAAGAVHPNAGESALDEVAEYDKLSEISEKQMHSTFKKPDSASLR